MMVVIIPSIVARSSVRVAPIIMGIRLIVTVIPLIVIPIIIVVCPVLVIAIAIMEVVRSLSVVISVTVVVSTVVVVPTPPIWQSWLLVILVPVGLSLVLTRVCILGLDLANRGLRCAVEHIIFALLDSVRSRLADRPLWPVRTLEGQMARSRTNCALQGLAEAILLLRKGAFVMNS